MGFWCLLGTSRQRFPLELSWFQVDLLLLFINDERGGILANLILIHSLHRSVFKSFSIVVFEFCNQTIAKIYMEKVIK